LEWEGTDQVLFDKLYTGYQAILQVDLKLLNSSSEQINICGERLEGIFLLCRKLYRNRSTVNIQSSEKVTSSDNIVLDKRLTRSDCGSHDILDRIMHGVLEGRLESKRWTSGIVLRT
jgi:hypothetical protein